MKKYRVYELPGFLNGLEFAFFLDFFAILKETDPMQSPGLWSAWLTSQLKKQSYILTFNWSLDGRHRRGSPFKVNCQSVNIRVLQYLKLLSDTEDFV